MLGPLKKPLIPLSPNWKEKKIRHPWNQQVFTKSILSKAEARGYEYTRLQWPSCMTQHWAPGLVMLKYTLGNIEHKVKNVLEEVMPFWLGRKRVIFLKCIKPIFNYWGKYAYWNVKFLVLCISIHRAAKHEFHKTGCKKSLSDESM